MVQIWKEICLSNREGAKLFKNLNLGRVRYLVPDEDARYGAGLRVVLQFRGS